MYICVDDVTEVQFKTLYLHDFVKNDQNTTTSCSRFFLHQINKIWKKNRGDVSDLVPL